MLTTLLTAQATKYVGVFVLGAFGPHLLKMLLQKLQAWLTKNPTKLPASVEAEIQAVIAKALANKQISG